MAFGWEARWIGLIASLSFCLVVASNDPKIDAIKIGVAVGNGFIIYVAAFGGSYVADNASSKVQSNATSRPGAITVRSRRLVHPFLRHW
jgi:hypothetical protein